MKNLNYIFNGILGVAVIILFVLHFSGNTPSGEVSKSQPAVESDSPGEKSSNIAYFKIDSVLANWEMYFNIQEQLGKKQQQLEADFENRSQSFMKRVEDAQYKMQRGLVTRAEAEQLQQQLATEEQNLMGLQNDYAAQLQEEGVVKNRQMIDKVEKFLAEYNKEVGYDYIFSYSFGGNLLYGNDAHDITKDVIAGINEMYPPED
ncbi:MAG: OmpH family outer membrane protein [Bacteroidales bacterium]|nr:OmpH family outer membrane protein [Bacteroidales bacterium]